MLPVTCVIDLWEHYVQAWGTNPKHRSVKLHDVPPWFNKRQAVLLESCVICHFCLWRLPSVTSKHYLNSHVAPKRPTREAGGRGGLYPFTHRVVAHAGGGFHAQIHRDLIEERKWLMRSGSPLGDAGLPRSKGWQSSPPRATSPDSFTICAPWPSPSASARLLGCSFKYSPQAEHCTYFFILILKGG